MKYNALPILFYVIMLLGACGHDEPKSTRSVQPVSSLKDTSFLAYARSIPLLDKDFTLSSSEVFEHMNIQSKYIPDGAGLIGSLAPINEYHFIIYSYPADIQLPVLEVYNSIGEKVNDRVLFNYGHCPVQFRDNHSFKLSPDRTAIYLHTTCAISFSNAYQDTIIIEDLISH